jgi:hypothetical protein
MPEDAPNTKVLESQAEALTREQTALEQQIEQLELKIATLSDTAAEKRREAQQAFRAKNAKRFVGVDPAKALAGLPAVHVVSAFGISYHLKVPNGEQTRKTTAFCLDPVLKTGSGRDTKTVDMGPVAPPERVLMAWMHGVSVPGQAMRDISSLSEADRLKTIRTLPSAISAMLSSECDTLDTYLTVVLELEMGNSSPTL